MGSMTTTDLIPPIGVLPQLERLFRLNWVDALYRSPRGVPLLSVPFVAGLGRAVHFIDVRTPEELIGPLGHIPGSTWVPLERAATIADRLSPFTPVVLVSRGGERASDVALELERRGMRLVAAIDGGMAAWKAMGNSMSRRATILERKDVMRAEEPWPSGTERTLLDEEKLHAHIGDPLSVRFVKMAALLLHSRQSCVDGRDDAGVIGTPGGDAGELLLALAAAEKLSGHTFTDADVKTLLHKRIDVFGRFYLHSDLSTLNTLIGSLRKDSRLDDTLKGVFDALEWRRFWKNPPQESREVLLEHLLKPDHIGCGHLKLSAKESEAYGARPALVLAFFRAFFELRWEGVDDAEFVPLAGGHQEGAVVNVRIAGHLRPYSLVPLVSPYCGGTQMFVNHPQVADFFRQELVGFLVEQECAPLRGLDEGALLDEVRALGTRQMAATLSRLAKGLPIFDVTFAGEQGVVVARVGTVGA
jgi:rhodanese-related sulfurtransferase